MSINVDYTEEQVINYLKDKLKINEEMIEKIKEEKIDGEALILLRTNDFKYLGFKVIDKAKIMMDKNITKMKKDIHKEDLYTKIINSTSTDPWDYLEMNKSKLKLGEKLKYIKYVFIRNPPPKIEKSDELLNYLKKNLKVKEDAINQIKDNIKEILDLSEKEFEDICKELDITEEDEQFKLKLIIEFIKSNSPNKLDKLFQETCLETPNDKLLKFLKSGKKFKLIQKMKDDIDIDFDFSLERDYKLYSMIELYNYETSQEEITSGLINPINEFQELCKDFNIDFKDEGTNIDYNKAMEIKISSSMLWGTRESLFQFFSDNGINSAITYFQQKERINKAGIYLCINKRTNKEESLYAFLIIWPGELDYKYNKIDKPNDNLLLTLIRYGFYITSNSILCFTNDEIKELNMEGYEIFKEVNSIAYEAERSKILINDNKQKSFEIGKKKVIKLEENKFENKITNKLLNQNCLLIYEERNNVSFHDTTINNIDDFLNYNSNYDILFDKNFEFINPIVFYYIIRQNHLYLDDISKEKYFFSKQSLKDAFRRKLNKIIDDLLKPTCDKILKIKNNNINNLIKCELCKNTRNNDDQDFGYINKGNIIIYFHKDCYKKYTTSHNNLNNIEITKFNKIQGNEEKLLLYEKYKIFNELKKPLKTDKNYKNDIINRYIQNCEGKFKSLSKKFDEKVILEEIDNIKEIFSEELFDKEKNELIGKEVKICEDFSSDQKKLIKVGREWESKWKEKINNYIKDNNIKKYIKLKSCQNINVGNPNKSNKLTEFKVHYEYIEEFKRQIYVNLFEIKPKQNSSDLALVFSRELGEENIIENYFPSYKKGLIINKEREKIKIQFKNKNIEEYNGLYDYDKISDTLILYRKEDKDKKLGIYFSTGESKTINCNEFVSDNSTINKIMLVPCFPAYEKQSVLLFIDQEIHMVQINNKYEFPKIINLCNEFNSNKFEEFQFIIHLDFLLILHFNKKWIGKVYSLSLEDDSLFNPIKEIKLDEDNEKTRFSFSEIKENKYLFSINIIGNLPIINFWEINSKLSGISTEYQRRNKKKQENTEISLGNCVANYFYHCFEKYPLLGALQYIFQKYDEKEINLSFYLKDDLNNKINSLEKYIDNLKSSCEKKKNISFHDMNFRFCHNYYKFFKSKNSSLGVLMINILEVTPIQIAKILEREFKIMSNGESIEKKLILETKKRYELHKDAKINIQNYSKSIYFSMKDSIFNFFEIPVVVICCFGTQSIGKSTFLNELTGSLFDVSGKRCTEGIWMSIKLFLHNIKRNEKKVCKKLCSNCKNNKCKQLTHEDIKYCLCKNCLCDKECFLKEKNTNSNYISCFKKCCLKKGHDISIRCSFENCSCNCVCECTCGKFSQPHNHICNSCLLNKNKICECECNCKHFCGIPIILHKFICVCLDFEGLGTFERTSEQDIQMALVGSALGNSIIFRTGNTFDKFTENTLEKLALGSNKIKNINIDQFFGGSLFFSPRDVNSTDKDKLKEEYDQKIENSVKKWNYSLFNSNKDENKIKNNKYTIFGLFDDQVFAPTPNYPDFNFYKTLRENSIKEIIENTLKFKKNPKYRTGKEFYLNLKLFLSAVYMNEYEFLTNFRESRITEYIYNNIDKAYEICGILKYNNNTDSNSSIFGDNPFKYYIKQDNLDELETDFIYNNKFEPYNSLIIENINISENIQGNYKSEKYGIIINVNKSDYNTFTISLENFNDFGLILLIFREIKSSVTYENLCSNLFEIWDNICKTLGFNDKMIIEYFNLFVISIIKRRKENVKKWLNEIINSQENLTKLKNQYSSIDNIWILCRQQCKNCYYNCCLLQGHKEEHQCPYNHKCKELCKLCIKSECSETNCEHICTEKSGHPEQHSCNHFHQCNEICIFKNHSNDCKGRCILKLDHEDNHFCGLENHHCNENCNLYGKANNCKGKCILIYPHIGKEHDCGENHFCINECCLKEKTKGCKVICNLEYGHKGNHYCGTEHKCIENCCLLGKSKNCFEQCILTYPHEGEMHNCGQVHYCVGECSLKNETSGCRKFCNLEYGHEGNHDCGEKHFCIADCALINLSEGCGGKCVLEYPHNGQDHQCSREHICKKNCQFYGNAKVCQGKCKLKYNHLGACICAILKEQHICNKKCYNCKKDCILFAGHGAQCICGGCQCPENCKYKDCSRGCQIKCKYKAGHGGNEHICNSKHFCKFECWLKNISKECEGYCSFEFIDSKEHSNHICNIPNERHGCNGICSHFENTRNCKKNCSKEVNHSGEHLCEINLNKHLCKNKCDLLNISINCKEICNLPFNHKGNHICSIEINNHTCNKQCSLFNKSRIGCNKKCSLIAGHSRQCICSNFKDNHICGEICDLFDKSNGCKKLCNRVSGHGGEHLCEISKDKHICKGICFLKGKTRGKCYENCCLSYGHNGICICKEKIEHLCDKECIFFNKAKGCNQFCNKPYGHSDEHLCGKSVRHICPNKCYYFGKCKGICKEYCMLKFGHKEKCVCNILYDKNFHLCNKNCAYYSSTRGCNKECSKKYEHDGPCKCNLKTESHFCKNKCELCKIAECGHVFNHENKDNNMKCCKCKDNICVLTGKKTHLCGAQHNCKNECEENGWCQIQSFVQLEEKIYKNVYGEMIKYKATKSQEIKKNSCCIKIKENESFHSNSHICEIKAHKCGYQCPQCEYYCTEDYGHFGLHNCFHGNIKNSYISVSDKGKIAKVKKDNKEYNFYEGERAIIFFCDGYCKEQGQGHIHEFFSYTKIQENENVRKSEKGFNIYECKCSYYWENILKFKSNFTTEEQKKFSLCNWKCKYASHQMPEYCQLPLWHQKTNFIPNGVYGKWIFEGHVFKCYHPISIYSIFLVDQSGSMASRSQKPSNRKIIGKLNNMLGASIQAVDSFCKLRSQKNFNNKCALIAFNDKAKTVFTDMSMENNEDIINICLSKLHPENNTFFNHAFEESYKILKLVDRNQFLPSIILLTDGIDHNYEKTKNLVKNVSK